MSTAGSAIETTVVVVPRESFNKFPEVIRRIYAVTPPIFKMLVMEGRSPERIRRELRAIEREHPACRVVWSNRWLYPHEAVNQAMRLLDTGFVVFVDNDVDVGEGWLEALVACAKEEGAGCVHPIYLTTKLSDEKIHVAEGKLIRARRNGRWIISHTMPFSGVKLSDYPNRVRKPSEFFEWHCVLFRKSLLERVGPLDDLTISEHLDYTLRLQEAGERIMLEPRAVVAYEYERVFRFRGADRRYFLHRWNVGKAKESLERFRDTWNLVPESTLSKLHWVKEHTGRVRHTYPLPRVINRVRRLAGLKPMPFTRDPKPAPLIAGTAAE